MRAIGSLFDAMDLLIVGSGPKDGGLPLPEQARIFPFRRPTGDDTRRKVSVVCNLNYYMGTILRYCREADVVHVPPPGDLQFLGMLAALWLRKKLIVRYCGSWEPTAQTTMMNRVTRLMMRSFAGGRNVMLATGGGERLPGKKVGWIFASALSEAELEGIKVDLDRAVSMPPRLVYAGRLSPEKGVAVLIRALAEMKRRGFALMPRLLVAGDGPERLDLERLARELGCGSEIQFAGQLNRADLSCAFQQSDLCVQPSLTEGYSKAWLDAMAHGVPVVASDVGAARAVIGREGERGWIVAPGEVEVLREQLERIICGKVEWGELRRRCCEFVRSQTLEEWARTVERACHRQWGEKLRDGERLAEPVLNI